MIKTRLYTSDEVAKALEASREINSYTLKGAMFLINDGSEKARILNENVEDLINTVIDRYIVVAKQILKMEESDDGDD